MTELSGTLPILPTIFDAEGKLDEIGMRRVLEYVLASGANGVVFPGLASEFETLSREERLQLTAEISRWIDGRVPFVVGASAATARESAEFAVSGAKAGAVAAMILTPKDFSGDVARLTAFYHEVTSSSGIAVMLQNAPAPMGIGLELDKVAQIARAVPGIRYVKEEAPPSGQRITRLTELAGDSLNAVYGGAGARHLMDELARGAKGTMPACEITEFHVSMVNDWQAGRFDQARLSYERTLPLLTMQAIFRWRLTKAVLLRRGLINSAFTRAAGPALDRHDERELDIMLTRLGIPSE
jgi:dihydrodipicolinate synthase/N-acetylneuraminate lyase